MITCSFNKHVQRVSLPTLYFEFLNIYHIWCGLIQKMLKHGQSVPGVQAGYLEQRSQMRWERKKIDKKCQKEWRSHFVLHYKSILQCLINLFDRPATKNISIKYKYCNTHNHSFSFLVYAHQQLEPYMQSPPASTWR